MAAIESSDDEMEGRNVRDTDDEDEPSDEEINDGFDLDDLFKERSIEVPTIDELKKEAKKFNDAHRYVLQKMMIDQSITMKRFNIHFIQYVATVKMKRNPCVVKYVKADIFQLRELANIIVKAINRKTRCDDDADGDDNAGHDLGMRLMILSEESNPTEWISLASEVQNSEILAENSEITQAERDIFLKIVEEMLQNNGKVSKRWISVQAVRAEKSISHMKCDLFVDKLVRDRWFFSRDDNGENDIEIAPRTLAEMEPFLRAKFGHFIKFCQLCHRIIGKCHYVAECEKCKLYTHYNCFKNATEISNSDGVECNKCGDVIELDDVKTKIDGRLKGKGPGRSSRRASNQSDEEPDELDPQEEVEEEEAEQMEEQEEPEVADRAEEAVKREVDDEDDDENEPVVKRRRRRRRNVVEDEMEDD